MTLGSSEQQATVTAGYRELAAGPLPFSGKQFVQHPVVVGIECELPALEQVAKVEHHRAVVVRHLYRPAPVAECFADHSLRRVDKDNMYRPLSIYLFEDVFEVADGHRFAGLVGAVGVVAVGVGVEEAGRFPDANRHNRARVIAAGVDADDTPEAVLPRNLRLPHIAVLVEDVFAILVLTEHQPGAGGEGVLPFLRVEGGEGVVIGAVLPEQVEDGGVLVRAAEAAREDWREVAAALGGGQPCIVHRPGLGELGVGRRGNGDHAAAVLDSGEDGG